ncbi:hypothetical protein D1B33_05560 [Lysinibacillus yapensis]|uniref:Extradiol ring-cleavage dioxygenase class III enzyme subunit B domain-containing protein n=1 Tax=Ureibacillus yapensis TaxID=2304605 RepID=A0A396SAI3_9BACL|nr:hypothetical protein D1B33_05560 [Lysinibacillus yapensis]
MLVPHVPSMCHEDQVPEFQQDMATALKEVAKDIQSIKPNVIVLVSCHWPAFYFFYYLGIHYFYKKKPAKLD